MMGFAKQLLQRHSLRVQSLFLMVAIGLVLTVIMSVTVYLLDISKIDSEISRRSRVQAALIQKLSLDALIAVDRPALRTVTEGLGGLDLGIDRMVITDFQGSVLASWEAEDASEGRHYQSVTPIEYKGQNFGTLELWWNHAKVSAPMKKRSSELALTVSVAIVILGMSFLFFVESFLLKPLNSLKRKVEALNGGKELLAEDLDFMSGEFRQLDQSLDEAVRIMHEDADREAQLQRERARVKVAEGTAAARSEFLSLMSHEIRTPLGAILGFAQLLESTTLDRDQSGYLRQISASGAFLLTILNDILDLSKIEANRMELAKEAFTLDDLMDSVHGLFSIEADKKGLDFSIDTGPGLGQAVVGDVHRIKQILMNLCGNAIKFTDSGEVSVQALPSNQIGDKVTVEFRVSDTGIGMTKEQAEKIFEPFSQADASITRRFGGTGLGVSISKNLVSIMGGELKVETEEGKGSTFTFALTFPIANEADEAGEPSADVSSFGGQSVEEISEIESLGRRRRVLVVDDDRTNRKLIKNLFKRFGQVAEFADDGQYCIEKLEADPDFDAVLLDLRMPRMGGLEVIQRIRRGEVGERYASIPIMVMSADVLSQDKVMAAGADDFVMKPIELPKLQNFLGVVQPLADHDSGGPRQSGPSPQDGSEGDEKGSNPRVMVVEDDPVVRYLMEKILTKWGYQAGFAEDGVQCLDALATEPYDIIVSDLRMPNMDGLTLISKIRSGAAGDQYRDAKIVLMTAEVMSAEDRENIQANAHLPKPIPITELRRFLEDGVQEESRVA